MAAPTRPRARAAPRAARLRNPPRRSASSPARSAVFVTCLHVAGTFADTTRAALCARAPARSLRPTPSESRIPPDVIRLVSPCFRRSGASSLSSALSRSPRSSFSVFGASLGSLSHASGHVRPRPGPLCPRRPRGALPSRLCRLFLAPRRSPFSLCVDRTHGSRVVCALRPVAPAPCSSSESIQSSVCCALRRALQSCLGLAAADGPAPGAAACAASMRSCASIARCAAAERRSGETSPRR